MPKAPPLVLTQAQFRRACAKSGVGAVSEADRRARALRVALDAAGREGARDRGVRGRRATRAAAGPRNRGVRDGVRANAFRFRVGNPGSSRDFVGKITYAPCRVEYVFAPERAGTPTKSASPRSRRTSASSCAGRTAARWPGSGTCSRTRRLSRRRQEKASAPSSRAPPDSRTVGQSDSDSNEGAGRTPSARWAWFTTARTKRRRFSAGTTTRSSRSPRIPPASGPPPARRAGRPACASGRRPRGRRWRGSGTRRATAASSPSPSTRGGRARRRRLPRRGARAFVTVAADATHRARLGLGRAPRQARARVRLSRAPGRGGASPASRRRASAAPPSRPTPTPSRRSARDTSDLEARARGRPTCSTATGARPQGAAAAAAAEAARARAAARAAALPGGAATFSLGYVAKTCVGEASISISRKESVAPRRDARAFAPGPGGGVAGLLVTGHADGRIRIWHGDALVCVSGADAHGAGEPVRALAISPPASAGRTVIVTGAGDGVARRWGVFAPSGEAAGTRDVSLPGGTARLEIRQLGELPVPREAPPGFAGAGAAPTRARSPRTRRGPSPPSPPRATCGLPPTPSRRRLRRRGGGFRRRGGGFRRVSDGKRDVFAVFAVFARVRVRDPRAALRRALRRVAPLRRARRLRRRRRRRARLRVRRVVPEMRRDGLGDGPDTGARDVAGVRAGPGAGGVSEAEDTEDRGALMLALGTADGQVRLVRLRLAAEEFSDVGKTKTKTYVARAVAAAASSSKRQPVTSLCFSPDGARLAAAADKTLAVHAVVGAISRAGARRTEWLPSRVACRGHRGAIVSADWSKDGSAVRTAYARARFCTSTRARAGRPWATSGTPSGPPGRRRSGSR